MKFRHLVLLFFAGSVCFSQQIEREHRIRKSQFPPIQTDLSPMVQKFKNIRHYKEVDSLETTYILKFKMDRMYYHLSFNENGDLKSSGLRVNELDIPNETFQKIKTYLSNSYEKSRIKRIFQQYPASETENAKAVLKSTFQNLLLPSNMYRVIAIGKNDKKNIEYDFWFTADGNPLRKRQALPMNHDRILY